MIANLFLYFLISIYYSYLWRVALKLKLSKTFFSFQSTCPRKKPPLIWKKSSKPKPECIRKIKKEAHKVLVCCSLTKSVTLLVYVLHIRQMKYRISMLSPLQKPTNGMSQFVNTKCRLCRVQEPSIFYSTKE